MKELGESKLHTAVINNKIGDVRKLINRGHPLDCRDNIGWTPLHEASNYGYTAIGELLIRSGANANIDSGDEGGMITPLMDAAGNGHLDFVRMLLRLGANIDKQNKNVIHVFFFHCVATRFSS